MNESNPYHPPAPDHQAMGRPAPPIFKAWFLFFVVATLGGLIIGLVVGVFLGIAMAAGGAGMESIALVGQGLGFLLSIPISYFAYRWSVTKFLL